MYKLAYQFLAHLVLQWSQTEISIFSVFCQIFDIQNNLVTFLVLEAGSTFWAEILYPGT